MITRGNAALSAGHSIGRSMALTVPGLAPVPSAPEPRTNTAAVGVVDVVDHRRRIHEGLARARAEGRRLGRPPKARPVVTIAADGLTCRDAAKSLGVSRSTVSRDRRKRTGAADPLRVRASIDHWMQLSMLMAALERCVEHCARLDAYRCRPWSDGGGAGVAVLDARLEALRTRIGHEIDRTTAERLLTDVTIKQTAQSPALAS